MTWNVDDRAISTSSVVLVNSFVIFSSSVLSWSVDDSDREISTAICFSSVFSRRVWWTSWMTMRRRKRTTTTWTRRTFASGLYSASIV